MTRRRRRSSRAPSPPSYSPTPSASEEKAPQEESPKEEISEEKPQAAASVVKNTATSKSKLVKLAPTPKSKAAKLAPIPEEAEAPESDQEEEVSLESESTGTRQDIKHYTKQIRERQAERRALRESKLAKLQKEYPKTDSFLQKEQRRRAAAVPRRSALGTFVRTATPRGSVLEANTRADPDPERC